MSAAASSDARERGSVTFRRLEIMGQSFHPFKNWSILEDRMNLCIPLLAPQMLPHAVTYNDFRDDPAAKARQLALHVLLRLVLAATKDRPADTVIPVLEVVPNKTSESVVEAYRLYFFIRADIRGWSAGEALQKLIADNESRRISIQMDRKDPMRFAAEQTKFLRYFTLDSRDKYLQMCSLLRLLNYADTKENASYAKDLHAIDNPANPDYVFSLEGAMRVSPDADPKFNDINNYVERIERRDNLLGAPEARPTFKYKFPDENRLYRLTSTQVEPMHFLTSYVIKMQQQLDDSHPDMPWMHKVSRMSIPPARLARFFADEKDTLEDSGPGRIPLLSEQITMDQARYILPPTRSLHEQSISHMKAANKNSRAKAVAQRQINVKTGLMTRSQAYAQFCADSRAWKLDAMETMFGVVWNEHAPESVLSNEHKAVVRHATNYRKDHRNYSGWAVKTTENLPFEAEWIVGKLFECEFVYWMHVAHPFAIIGFLSQLDASYPDRKNKLHMLQLGPGGTSKSYVLDVVHGQAIDGTVFSFNYSSAKEKTGRINTDGGCFQMHEANDRAMGVGASAGKASDDALNFLKAVTTSGRFVATVLVIDRDTGRRSNATFDTNCNNTFQLNSNRTVFDIEPAFLTRFFVAFYSQTERDDKSLLDCLGIAPNDMFSRVKKHCGDNYKRQQILFTAVCKAIELGILAPVRTDLATLIIFQVLREAELRGLSTTLSRSARIFNRMMSVVRVLAILSGNSRVFDAIDSPVRMKPWENKDLLLVEPFLRATPQMTIIALGIAKQELINPITNHVMRAMRDVFFRIDHRGEDGAILTDNGFGVAATDGALLAAEEEREQKERERHEQERKERESKGDAAPSSSSSSSPVPPATIEDLDVGESEKRYLNELKKYSFYWYQRQENDRFGQKVHYLILDAKEFAELIGGRKIRKPKPQRKNKNTSKAMGKAKGKSKTHGPAARELDRAADDEGDEDATAHVPGDAPTDDMEQQVPKSDQERWRRMAQKIRGRMVTHPALNVIISFMRDMHLRQTIDVKTSTGNVAYPVLDFTDEGGLLVACRALLSADSDIIKDSIIEVMSNSVAEPQRYVYEMQSVKTPFLLSYIDIKPNEKNVRKSMNPTFCDSQQRRFVQGIMRDNDGKDVVTVEEWLQPVQEMELDEDIDKSDFMGHLQSIGWDLSDVGKYHFGDSRATQKRLLQVTRKYYRLHTDEKMHQTKIPKYPDEVHVERGPHSTAMHDEQKVAKELYPQFAKLSKQHLQTIETFGLISATQAGADSGLGLGLGLGGQRVASHGDQQSRR